MIIRSVKLTQEEKEGFMREALLEAKKAEIMGEVPIGAVVVLDGEVIGRGHNVRETSQDATTHAEMIAIRDANRHVKSWRLEKAQLFVTLEPCPMCSGGILLSRIDQVFYGAKDPKGGAAGSLMNLLQDMRFNHSCYVETGILEEECGSILTNFFRKIRQEKKAKKG
ncbi:tRNA adenosine(34) deaminase TadA [Vagococcus carniphilus]|uniref:tRNA-specific adenosine deaminase n=1 Tax=Vagococcus carniphilus TaxID=218144 RepID=A0AAW8U8B5_9ENTE|nr:tRNA adenosine(34) deaminase TadA [Vagococcus carniphilus]MDT2814127.1 tRNA adenosine(34) deaminase TadA [Vagococcus carniphilus]MDT2834231.1 tRNA adenosine(34) deaminase TadA [Vagococcus carniphilus]MDT2847890.1 tRNA adenosine(34) deaminase TadA [Vagococcus carniphilus]MDT2863849.1 tRNA adenosine(34) deaminase TadA [Vagococcus carniphilus]